MLRIRDNNSKLFFDIKKGTTIDFELNNPAFNYSIQQTSFSYSLTLEVGEGNGNNARIFGHANRPDVVKSQKKKSLPVTIFIGMTPVFEGVMYLINSTTKTLKVNIVLQGGEFLERLSGKKLEDLTLDNGVNYVTLANMGTSIPFHTNHVAFPTIHNPNFGNGNTTEYVNDFHSATAQYRYNLAADVFDRRNYRVCPFFKLEHVMWSVAQSVGYNVGIINEDLSIFNNSELYHGLVIHNRTDQYNFYEDPFPGSNRIYYKDHLPEKVHSKTLFAEVAKLFAMSYRFDIAKKSVTTIYNKSLLNASTLGGILDWTKKATYDDGDSNNATSRSFGYNPDLNEGDFFKTVSSGSGGSAEEILAGVGSLPYDSGTLITQDTKVSNRKIYELERKSTLASRLLMYRHQGLVNIKPIATAAPTSGYNYSLEWDGSNGLYNQFHKEWAEFQNNADPVVYKVDFTIRDLLNFDIQKQVSTRFGRYLIKKLKLKISNTDNPLSTPAVVEMLEVPL